MTSNGKPRRRLETPREPTSLTECARRYHGAALALARTFGIPLTLDFIRQYHPAISSVYIESSRAGVRLPPAIQLPALAPVAHVTPEAAPPSVSEGLAESSVAHVTPEPEPASEPLPPGEGEGLGPSTNGQAPPPSTIPVDAGLPCAGQRISDLKPPALLMIIHRVAALVHAEGEAWVMLLGSLQAERARRMARGRKTAQLQVDLKSEVE